MSRSHDPANLLSNPEWFPSHWEPQGNRVQLVLLARERHSELTFLADEYLRPLNLDVASATIAELGEAKALAVPPPHYIFHSAFSASTLLTRALDLPGVAMGLKEPEVLNELAEAARSRRLPADVLRAIVAMLARPLSPGEKIVIKPSNVANLLAPALLELDAGSRAVFLFAPIPRFLRSVADKGLWGRRWARRLHALAARDTRLDFGLSPGEQFELTDLQVAALAWLMQHAQAMALLAAFPDRVRTLDSEVFLARRAETITAVAANFGLPLDERQAREVADGPAFKTHSKEIGRAFDPEEPLQSKTPVPIIDEEIAMVAQWARSVAEHAGIPLDLPPASALLSTR